MSRLKDLQKNLFGGTTSNARQFGMIFTLVAIVVLFQILTDGLTLRSDNLIALFQQNSYILILAIGMLMVIVAGHIDLSVGSVAAFAGILVAKSMTEWDLPWPAAIVFGLAIGAVIGAWQGFWVAYIGVPAFIVTLAGMLLFRGGNQFIGNASTVPVPEGFREIGSGFLPEFGPNTGYNNATLLLGLAAALAVVWREIQARKTRRAMDADPAPMWISILRMAIMVGVIAFAALRFASGRVGTSFPISGIILLVLVIAYSFYTRNTAGGRHIYAVGGNSRAAELSGVKLKRVNFFVMMNMSVLAALAGMIFVARSAASGPQDGNGWELDAIAAVFIGGAAVAGGIGTISGSIVGGLVMAVLNNGLQLMGVGTDRVQIIKGLVLLLAVAIDVYNKSQGRFSIIGSLMRPFRRDDSAPPTSPPDAEREPAKAAVSG
ncbi:multiple monosaccharide ABC transporter permease [Micromonospora vinacea]|uniref:Xylose transport system permease protein XylH n=1 Tax=Micromonospora vinacea TaxID=709878 RepID=A0ABS0K4D0_9ACTN|nr:multiple monosaccharide ABC transporter permease [Micromonospora vinacea]MBG6103375.1 putative multiple sugar transport system permease protein [Micromonospora vinacea]WSZ73884.1 sugar ABC transporter permease [Micromonospora sp. NBC_00860]WTA69623.1 sugar ABC transporter permease [Micromonospora sp. NBC_00855]